MGVTYKCHAYVNSYKFQDGGLLDFFSWGLSGSPICSISFLSYTL